MAASIKEASIRIHQLDTIPEDARVAHFDELSDLAKERLFTLVSAGADRGRLELMTAAELAQYDLVKFTDYYCVDFA